MTSLFADLVPFALGTLVSPLALIAVVAILLSRRPSANGGAFLIGWTVAILVVLVGSAWVASAFTVSRPSDPPSWVGALHLAIGVVLLSSGVWTMLRWRRRAAQMAAASTPAEVVKAAPQLPGWLRSVEHFEPFRCGLLGFALFAFNPVDLSCGIGAGLTLRVSEASTASKVVAAVVFVLLSMVAAAVPVLIYAVKRESAKPILQRLRTWIAGHNGWLSAVIFLAIGVMQVVKGVQQL